ncbi:MAPEG family protein [Marinobacter daepoensis]|uniref:MAPEG family protein n=1 Tax=Marinobacter daepoensis TaxID=262077 RepID=A0ABS3BE99_9GAMM|nr:MAPEG family protein [Marinobacter daepoensis]MBN7770168.1 MAPEG family protein [Marinobacter daepoensis]MBY6033698.1 MAPEG family protein [Marinobacter daepoensis]MBY6079614.1 MAPEG family protein [Marinobacter daepoensis]
MIVPVTAVFAAVTGLLLLVLSAQVVKFRLKYRKGLGVTDDPEFEAAVRAQANLVEYAPLGLIMLAIAELNGVSGALIYWTGMALVVGRILHAWGMINGKGGPHLARMIGILLTWLAILVAALLLFWNVWQVYG